MSQRNALRNPRRTGATASALMVGLALVAGMSVAGASMTRSFDEQIDRTLGADFVVQSDNFGPFPPEVTERVEGGRRGPVVRQRFAPMRADAAGRERTSTSAGARPAAGRGRQARPTRRETPAAALAPGSIGLDAGVRGGPRAAHRVARAGRVPQRHRTGADRRGAHHMDRAAGSGGGRPVPRARRPLERYLPGGQDAASSSTPRAAPTPKSCGAAWRRRSTAFRRSRCATRPTTRTGPRADPRAALSGLRAAGSGDRHGGAAAWSTPRPSVVERTREIGLLRAVGLSRCPASPEIRLESVVIAVFGAVLGLVWAWCGVLRRRRCWRWRGWRRSPFRGAGRRGRGGSVLVGLAAALLPALRASRMNVLAAIAHE